MQTKNEQPKTLTPEEIAANLTAAFAPFYRSGYAASEKVREHFDALVAAQQSPAAKAA